MALAISSIHRNGILKDRENNSNFLYNRNYNDRTTMSQTSNDRNVLKRNRIIGDRGRDRDKSAKTSTKNLINYKNMFVDAKSQISSNGVNYNTPRSMVDKDDGLSMLREDVAYSYEETRLSGGANRTQQQVDKLILSPSQYKLQPAGLAFFDPKSQVNIVHLQLSDRHHVSMNLEHREPLLFLPHIGKRKTRGTQTLYRESSAQTLPYLPGVSNDPDELESLEIFKLPTILPGDGPPGLYEVEVLQRARRRWAFAKALKDNFCKQLEEAHEQVKLQKHHHILEAFEWEHWLEREEYIQECQMLRLEILIRMFDRRERQMQNASHARIQKSCEVIEAQRKTALKKNEIEYARALRRLDMKHSKQPRVWRKEHITQELGDYGSEFYAPKMRYGVNPNRRHYSTSRKSFNIRMDDLEKRTVKMDYKHLTCPLAKLKEWSRPKVVLQEVEQNFCSEVNLKKLYDSMRTLRETSRKPKTTPLCLKAKVQQKSVTHEKYREKEKHILKVQIKEENAHTPYSNISRQSSADSDLKLQQREDYNRREDLDELRKRKQEERENIEMLKQEMRCEELEALMNSYEGHTIGWLMRFLSDEMGRVKEQRKLHFFTMLAKRERWHREAAEAGLRQKENYMREEYEKLYEECQIANKETAEKFMESIMDNGIKDYAKQKAEDHVTAMAKEMDKEISNWLESFRDIQNPLNYYSLRYALKDIVMPDKEKLLYGLERDDCIDYIINEVLLGNVYHLLEPYDVSFSLANDFVDRLIDNDLYLESSDCSSECSCECSEFCTCSKARQEAMAILRKVIRRSVPGKRWRSPNERVAFENVQDLLDDVFDRVIPENSLIEGDMQKSLILETQEAHTNLFYNDNDFTDNSEKTSSEEDIVLKMRQFKSMFKLSDIDITKSLENNEILLLEDPDKISEDRFIVRMEDYELPKPEILPQLLHKVPSNHKVANDGDFTQIDAYNETSFEDIKLEEELSLEEEFIARLQRKSSNETMIEMENTGETWAIEMSSSHDKFDKANEKVKEGEEQKPSEGAEEEDDRIVDDKLDISEHVVETVPTSVRFNEQFEEKFIEPEPENKLLNDDDVDGVMEVTFSYDPAVKYSVPVPSGNEMAAASGEVDTNEE